MDKKKVPGILKKLNPEEQLLIYCSRTNISSKIGKRISALVSLGVNWDSLLKITIEQKVFPLLYISLKKHCFEYIPEEIREKFRAIYYSNATRNIQLTNSLLKIIQLFEDQGIQSIPFKGPVLAQDIFGNLEDRSFSDLDILINKKDAHKAKNLLENTGFKSNIPDRENIEKNHLKSEYSLTFSNKKISIDLHWELRGRYIKQCFDTDDIFKNIEKLNILESEVNNLPPEYLLIYLCLHGSKDQWSSLNHICCVSELIRNKKNLDWQTIIMLSEEMKCKKTLLVGVNIAYLLFEINIPKEMKIQIDDDSKLKQITFNSINKLFNKSKSKFDFLGLYYFNYLILDNFIDKFFYCIQKIFRPAYEDIITFPVSSYFYFLLYLLRPIRIFLMLFKIMRTRV